MKIYMDDVVNVVFTGAVIVIGTVFVLGLSLSVYANWNLYSTKIKCIDAGYPNHTWTFQTGGICSRTENSNTVMVKVDSL